MDTFGLGDHYYAHWYIGVRVYTHFHWSSTMFLFDGSYTDTRYTVFSPRSFIVSNPSITIVSISHLALLHLSLDHVHTSVSFSATIIRYLASYSWIFSTSSAPTQPISRCSILAETNLLTHDEPCIFNSSAFELFLSTLICIFYLHARRRSDRVDPTLVVFASVNQPHPY